MNKDELEKELKKYVSLYEKEKENNDFLLKQQSKFKKMAEDAGSNLAPYKAMALRLRDELNKLNLN